MPELKNELVALKRKDMAKRYGIDPRTFDKMVDTYNLPYIKIDRIIIYPVKAFDEAFLKATEIKHN